MGNAEQEAVMSDFIMATTVQQVGTEKMFYVSTCNCECSAAGAYGMIYAGTLVWEVDDKGNRGRMIYSDSAPRDCVRTHLEVCMRLRSTGRAHEEDTDAG
jgi:hypothetical protein